MMHDRTSSISASAQKRRAMSKSLADKKDLRMLKMMNSDTKQPQKQFMLPKNLTSSSGDSQVSAFNEAKPRRQPSQKPQVDRRNSLRFKSDKKRSAVGLEYNDSNGLQTENTVDNNFIQLREQR